MRGGGGCGSRQRQVANGADVVFTDTEKPVGRKTFRRIIGKPVNGGPKFSYHVYP